MDTNTIETKPQAAPARPIAATTNDTPGDTRFETKESRGVNVKALEVELRAHISGEVRFDDGSRALYATDASNYRQVPIGVVIPRNEQDICTTIALCHQYHAPVLSRGGGTSLAGQCCNVAVLMDMSKYYNQVLEIDKDRRLVRIQPGIVLDEMRKATDEHNRTLRQSCIGDELEKGIAASAAKSSS